ncbi:unnamed protein product, partial [Staurois parvus]
WGPRAIGDHGAPVSLPKLKKAYEKGTRGISWGPLLTPGPRAVPEFPNGQSTPGEDHPLWAAIPLALREQHRGFQVHESLNQLNGNVFLSYIWQLHDIF